MSASVGVVVVSGVLGIGYGGARTAMAWARAELGARDMVAGMLVVPGLG